MSILDLSPREFVAALDEFGLSPEERERLTGLYRQHNSAFAETRERLQATDAELAEQGMRRGSIAPISFPEGMTGFEALRSGEFNFAMPSMPGEIATALLDAVEMPSALLSGVPVSREESEQAALTAAELAVPGALAVRGVDRAVDTAQRNQAHRYFDRITPEFPGEPYSGSQFFHPNQRERTAASDPSATPVEAEHLSRRGEARRQRTVEGVPASDVAAATGVLAIPTTPFSPRQGLSSLSTREMYVAPVSAQEMLELRPQRANDYGIQVEFDPAMPENSAAYYAGVRPDLSDSRIIHSTATSPEEFAKIQRHEMTHADLDFGGVPNKWAGTNLAHVNQVREEALSSLNRRIKKATDPDEKAALKQQKNELESFTPLELYYLNPGEMLARLSEGDPTTAVSLTNTELLNPYINQAPLPTRLMEGISQSLGSQRPTQQALGFSLADIPLEVSRTGVYRRGTTAPARPVLQWGTPKRGEKRYSIHPIDYHSLAPMDLSRARVPEYRNGGMVSAAEILMSETPPHSPALEPRTPAQAPAKSQAKHKIQRVMGGDGKFRVRFVEQA